MNSDLRGYWLSRNPSKAWGEKFFLWYLPFFFALNAAKQVLDIMNVSTFWHITQNVAMLAPLYIVPLLIRDEANLGRRWYQTYWFKANVWIYIFAFFATYFFTEYFFDVLGMVYYFPGVSLYFDAALLGSGEQQIPLGMYFNGAAFFVVYHNLAVVCLRRLRTSSQNRSVTLRLLAVLALAYLFAWAETRLVATDKNAPYFYYEDLGWMLRWGSLFYACYFVVSFPMFYRIDEGPDENWPVARVCLDACAAAMLVFFLLDIAMRFIHR